MELAREPLDVQGRRPRLEQRLPLEQPRVEEVERGRAAERAGVVVGAAVQEEPQPSKFAPKVGEFSREDTSRMLRLVRQLISLNFGFAF